MPHIGTLSGAGGYSMPFHGDPKILAFCPGEVRHRKRTSRQQLSVLEDIFTTDQKPGPALRKKLALELEMTPRSVQVCDESIPKLLCGGGGGDAGVRGALVIHRLLHRQAVRKPVRHTLSACMRIAVLRPCVPVSSRLRPLHNANACRRFAGLVPKQVRKHLIRVGFRKPRLQR